MFLFLLSTQIIALMLLGASIAIFERKSKLSHYCYVAMLYACLIAFGALALGSVFYLVKWIGD